MNGLAHGHGESFKAIRKNSNHTASVRHFKNQKNNNKIQYLANVTHPLFPSLRKKVHEYSGLVFIAENVTKRIGASETIFLL